MIASRKKTWISITTAVLLILLTLCTLSFTAIRSEWESTIEDPDSIDILIVLGAGVWGDQPSPQLKLRIETASAVYAHNPNMILIVSGGQGPDELISEAQAMRDALIDLDVPAESIFLEAQSTSTVENLRFSKRILNDLDLENPAVGIVTTDFHMYRAKMLARRFGIVAQGQSSPNIPSIIIKNTLREIAAVLKDTVIR